MRYIIKENWHYYLPFYVWPRFNKVISFDVELPSMTWYDSAIPAGWNKLLMVGRFLHYSDYATIGWQWWDAQPGDDNVYKGRVLKMAAVYHDNWSFPEWKIFDGTMSHESKLKCKIERYDDSTIFSVNDQTIPVPVNIRGNWVRSPYFGGRGKAQYFHSIKIDVNNSRD